MNKVIISICIAVFLIMSAQAENIADLPKIEIGTDTVFDLAGSGIPQTIRAQYVGVEDDAYLQIVVFGSDGGVNLFDTVLASLDTAVITDIDSDGSYEILVTGDILAMDYATYCLTFNDDEGIRAIPFADIDRGSDRTGYTTCGYGLMTELSGPSIRLEGWQDILGTHPGSRTFAMSDHRMELNDDGLWHFSFNEFDWDFRSLTLKQPMEVIWSDSSAGTLSAGTRIMITASDLVSIVYFTDENGKNGSFAVEPDTAEGWGSLINGIREDEWFEYLPYSG